MRGGIATITRIHNFFSQTLNKKKNNEAISTLYEITLPKLKEIQITILIIFYFYKLIFFKKEIKFHYLFSYFIILRSYHFFFFFDKIIYNLNNILNEIILPKLQEIQITILINSIFL